MRVLVSTTVVAFCLGLVASCEKPDSIEFGGICREQIECKDPADTCLTVGPRARCSKKCSKKDKCPDGFVCAKLDITVQRDSKSSKAGEYGYCLPKSEVPANAVTL